MECRLYAALVSLFLGTFILFEGVTPEVRNLADWGMILLGVALVLSYAVLLGKRFENWLKKSSIKVFAPVLFAVGAAIAYQALFRAGLTIQLSFLIPGIVLILTSVVMLGLELKHD